MFAHRLMHARTYTYAHTYTSAHRRDTHAWRAGQPVDQWFMLQRKDGSQLIGPSGRPSALRLQILYDQAPLMQPHARSNPLPVPHIQLGKSLSTSQTAVANVSAAGPTSPVPPASPPVVVAGTEPTLPGGDVEFGAGGKARSEVYVSGDNEDTSAYGANAVDGQATPLMDVASMPALRAAGVPTFCMSLEIVEARNLARLDGLGATQPYAAVSLIASAHTLLQHHYLLIDHRLVLAYLVLWHA